MGAFKSVGSLVRRVALWSLCAGFICEAQAQTRTWTGTTKTYWLNVSVGGNFSLGADAAVDVSALGYTKLYNESGETLGGNVGGSYGGWGCSPALKLGFRPIDLSKVGPREGALVR